MTTNRRALLAVTLLALALSVTALVTASCGNLAPALILGGWSR